jgi:hypothetical protein
MNHTQIIEKNVLIKVTGMNASEWSILVVENENNMNTIIWSNSIIFTEIPSDLLISMFYPSDSIEWFKLSEEETLIWKLKSVK